MANSLDPSVQEMRKHLLGDLLAVKTQEVFPSVEQMRSLMDRTRRFTEFCTAGGGESLHDPRCTAVETKIQIQGVKNGTTQLEYPVQD